jgi:hypothetical protein
LHAEDGQDCTRGQQNIIIGSPEQINTEKGGKSFLAFRPERIKEISRFFPLV